MRLIIDSHLDLGWHAVSFNRDLTLSIEQLRQREAGMTDEKSRGKCTITLEELHRGGFAVVLSTLLARGGPDQEPKTGYLRTDLDFASQSIAQRDSIQSGGTGVSGAGGRSVRCVVGTVDVDIEAVNPPYR